MSDNNHSEETLLIAKHLSGETTSAEEEVLQKWIALSSENEQLYLKFKRIYEVSGKVYDRSGADALDIDVEKEWDHFEKEVELKGRTIEFKPQTKSGMWLRIAAALLLLMVSGVVINYFVGKGGEQIYQTAENTEIITLPDGSTVSLNRNSTLIVKNSFAEKNRGVELLGEAFFEVVPDPQLPFVIEVSDAEVTVLGTSFNVQNLEGENEVEVIVETGIVKLEAKEVSQSVELNAGEKGVFRRNEKELISHQNTDVNFLSWKTKNVVFNNTDLKSVVETLQSTYGVEITISAEVSADCEITVTFENQSLEAVLKVLQSTLGLTYKWVGNKIEITGAGC